MHSFVLTVTNPAEGSEISSQVRIPQDEYAALIDFANNAEELASTRVLQQELRVQIRIKFEATGRVTFSGTLPHDDVVAALLHRIRPFVLTREANSFLRIRNLLAKRIENSHIREILDYQGDLFTAALSEN